MGPIVNGEHAAIGRAAEAVMEEPPATTNHPDHPCGPSGRIGYRTGRIPAKPVLAPLPDVAVHVIQTPGVGSKSYRRKHSFSVLPLGSARKRNFAVIVDLIP